jgi:hypothetical protein
MFGGPPRGRGPGWQPLDQFFDAVTELETPIDRTCRSCLINLVQFWAHKLSSRSIGNFEGDRAKIIPLNSQQYLFKSLKIKKYQFQITNFRLPIPDYQLPITNSPFPLS